MKKLNMSLLKNIKKINIPLLIGSIILIFIFGMCLYPEYFTEADPYGRERTQYKYENGKSILVIPPIPPNDEYPLGTDHRGRGLKSLIIYGSKLTIFSALTVALIRLIIALPLSIAAAYKVRFTNGFINFFNIMFSAFPLIIAVIVLSNIALFQDIFKDATYVNIFLLSVLGWSRLSHILRTKIDEILMQDFIEGEVAIGKNKLEIAVQNIIPHLIPSIIVLFFLETAMVLLSFSQLGVFGLVFGSGYEGATGEVGVPIEFDWPSLLSLSKYFYRGDYSYLSIYPAIAFAFAIIGFNTFGEGLKIEFEKENSRVITFIRAMPSFLSPIRLIYEIKNYKQYKRSVLGKVGFYITILLIIFCPKYESPYGFDENNAFKITKELTDDIFKGRLTGFQDKDNNPAQYIVNKLKEYGVKAYGDDYILENTIQEVFNIKYAELSMIDTKTFSEKKLKFRQDYIVASNFNYDGILDAENIEINDGIFENMANEPDYYKEKALIIDIRSMTQKDFISLNGFMKYYVQPNVVIFIENWKQQEARYKSDIINKNMEDTVIISLSSEAGDELLRMGKCKLKISVNAEKRNDVIGRSVVAYIPGIDESKKNDFVIIGSNLDGIGYDLDEKYPSAGRASSAAISLEIARTLIQNEVKPDRDIIFAFWDGNMTDDRGSKSFFYKYLINRNYRIFYIDLMNLGYKSSDKLMIDNTKIFPNSKEEQDFIKRLKKNAKRNDFELVYGTLYSPAVIDFTGSDSQPLLIDSFISNEIVHTPKDTLEEIDTHSIKQVGQMLLDTLIDSFSGGSNK